MGVGEMTEQIKSRTAQQHDDSEVDAATKLTRDMERARVEYNSDGSIQSFNLEGLWRLGTMYSQTKLVPEHYRNSPADCAIAVQMAQRCKVDPMAFMQSSFIVSGRPGIETKFAVAMLNRSGLIQGPIRHREVDGEDGKRAMVAVVVCSKTLKEITGTAITTKMIKEEGWEKNKKWTSMRDHMMRYRSSIFLIRQYFPEVLLGMMTTDELEDIDVVETAQVDINNGQGTELRRSRSKLAALAETAPPPEQTQDEAVSADAAETVTEQTPTPTGKKCMECECDVCEAGPNVCPSCAVQLEAQASGKMF